VVAPERWLQKPQRPLGAVELGSDSPSHDRAFAPSSAHDVVLEVGAVTAMCSSGFEALLLLYRLCKDGALPLKLRGPKPEYHQLLQRMGFTRLFAIEP